MISHQRQIFPPLVRLSHPARPSFTLGKLSSLLITLAALIENELCKLATTIAERLRNPRQITSLPSVSLSKWCSTSAQRPTIYRDTGKIRTIQRRSFQMSSRLPISSMLFNLICSTKSITHRQKEREMASKQLQIRLGLQLSSLRQKCQIQELSVVRSTCKHLRDKAKMWKRQELRTISDRYSQLSIFTKGPWAWTISRTEQLSKQHMVPIHRRLIWLESALIQTRTVQVIVGALQWPSALSQSLLILSLKWTRLNMNRSHRIQILQTTSWRSTKNRSQLRRSTMTNISGSKTGSTLASILRSTTSGLTIRCKSQLTSCAVSSATVYSKIQVRFCRTDMTSLIRLKSRLVTLYRVRMQEQRRTHIT